MLSPLSLRVHRFLSILSLGGDRDGARFQRQDLPLLCHFGTVQLCGETDGSRDSKAVRFEGVKGYMSPDFQASGVATQESDVFAFGVMMLELLSGEEPLKYTYEKTAGDFERTLVIETAKAVVDGGDGGDIGGG
uniref:Protein kinase domain-containing protein n=1 Tax=Brassica oleracea TaxID=3712 RepID=A0A3P6ANA0_BRAOL|nr:unnamed protein product [Brassica oleracea]